MKGKEELLNTIPSAQTAILFVPFYPFFSLLPWPSLRVERIF